METIKDKWGRDVTLAQSERGFVYAGFGVELVYAERDDARALEQFNAHDAPAAGPVDDPVDLEARIVQFAQAFLDAMREKARANPDSPTPSFEDVTAALQAAVAMDWPRP